MDKTVKTSTMAWSGLIILVLLFLTAFGYLFSLRFERGDFLPAYSSLRRDPMGTAVLFESLAKSGLQVLRNHKAMALTELEPGDTLFLIGLKGGTTELFAKKSVRQKITDFIKNGGRLVITYSPLLLSSTTEKDTDETTSKTENQECGVQKNDDNRGVNTVAYTDENREELPPIWAVATKQLPTQKKSEPPILAKGQISGKQISMIWPNTLVFSNVDPQWKILLRTGDQPVLMEKRLGAGSVVLATSSHFLSNEAMLRGRQVALLRWLLGTADRIIFDEFHHGLRSSRSVTALIRSYNLHGVIGLIFLLAALFLWKSRSSLLPPVTQDTKTAPLFTGRDQFEGMVGLLRRYPPENLLFTALEQWKNANRDWCHKHPATLTNIEALSQIEKKPSEDEEVARYRTISRLLHPQNQPYNSHHE